MAENYDSPWKQALDLLLEQFLELFFPEVHAAIDWSRAPENLETELASLSKDSEIGPRRADKLFRVHLLSGKTEMLLIHIEVQTTVDSSLPKRIFVYWYRIFDYYDTEPITLVLLGDDNPRWRPRQFHFERFGFKIGVTFPMVKLLDFARQEKQLLESPNPFALEVVAYLKTRDTRADPEARLEWKFELTRRVLTRGFEPKLADDLVRMLDWMMSLPKELELKFYRRVEALKETEKMRYVTTFERFAEAKGRDEGRQEGRQEGLLEGQVTLLLSLLKRRFGDVPSTYLERLKTADLGQLSRWGERVLDAASLNDVFAAG